jgi:hypothetical protein
MPAVQPCCQQVSAVQRCKVLPARTLLRQGDVPAKVDSSSYSIWVDAAVYSRNSSYPVDEGGESVSADGSTLSVLGNGRMTMGFWGGTFDVLVRVMHRLPSQILIGGDF